MKLPNRTEVELGTKIEEYCLNLNHPDGQHKAIKFKNRLGITFENADVLKQALKEAAINENVVIRKVNDFGVHYNMKFMLKTKVGESLVLACWIIRTGEEFPRLTNCYPVDE